jgi:MFS family permease
MITDDPEAVQGRRTRWVSGVTSPWFVRLMVVTGIAQFISSSIRPLITYQTLATGAGPFEVGLVAAGFSGLALFAAIPLGKTIDRRGEVGFLILGGGLVTITLVALMVPAGLVALGVCSAGLGLGHLALVAAGQTLIAKGSSPERRETRFGLLTSVNAVSQIVGPIVTGLLIGDVARSGSGAARVPGSTVVLAIAAGLGIVATASALSLRFRPGALVRRAPAEAPPPRGAFRTVMRLPAVPTAMFASLTVLTCIDLLGTYLPVFGQQHGLSARTVGLLLATEGVASMVVRVWMLRLIARFSRRRLLIGTMTIAAVSVASVPLWGLLDRPLPGVFAAMVVAGLGLGVGQPASMAWVASETPPSLRGTSVSIRLTGNRLGLIAVPICAGALAGTFGLAAAFWWPAVLLLIGVAFVVRTPRPAGAQSRELPIPSVAQRHLPPAEELPCGGDRSV